MKKQAIITFSPQQQGLQGNVAIRCFRNGLLCKYADLTAQKSGVTDEGMFAAGIRLIITLQGGSELAFERYSLIYFYIVPSKVRKARLLPFIG